MLEKLKKQFAQAANQMCNSKGEGVHSFFQGQCAVLEPIIAELEAMRKEAAAMQPPVNDQLLTVVKRFLASSPMLPDYTVYEDAKKLVEQIKQSGASIQSSQPVHDETLQADVEAYLKAYVNCRAARWAPTLLEEELRVVDRWMKANQFRMKMTPK